MDIAAWLAGHGLERYEAAFRENEIDVNVLPRLTADDLKDLGVVIVGHRRKLLEAIAKLNVGSAGASVAPSPGFAGPVPHRDAERRQLTLMFIDLVGSTALSAKLDPEDMRVVIRLYQNTVAGEIARFDGHIAKFMGDGVLAYFGWPKAHEDEAERAVRAGLAVTESVLRLQAPGGESLQTRIGIATGLVVVGDLIGEGAAQEPAVVGDTPNLAARLQSAAEPGTVVIADSTRHLVGDLFLLRELGAQNFKGIAEPVSAFAVLGERAVESRFAARRTSNMAPIVARDQELALLMERWRQAKSGEGQMVLLSGEAALEPLHLGIAADAYSRAARHGEAEASMDKAFAALAHGHHQAFAADLHRLRGVLSLRAGSHARASAESDFRTAMKIGHQQGALSLELRAARDLARLLAEQGERRQAMDLLAPLYGAFTEGFDTPDLKEAKALLDELRA